jgi:hypothetical protein
MLGGASWLKWGNDSKEASLFLMSYMPIARLSARANRLRFAVFYKEIPANILLFLESILTIDTPDFIL